MRVYLLMWIRHTLRFMMLIERPLSFVILLIEIKVNVPTELKAYTELSAVANFPALILPRAVYCFDTFVIDFRDL